MEAVLTRFAVALRKARKSAGITQVELANRTGMMQGDVSSLECGARNPTLNTLRRLAKALGQELVLRLEPEGH